MLPTPDPTHATLQEYVIIFDDDAPPKKCDLSALSDQHAVDLLEKEYPAFQWKLYRSGGQSPIFTHRPKSADPLTE
jgi:hypothetical protein